MSEFRNPAWEGDNAGFYVWISNFTAKLIPKNQMDLSVICYKHGPFALLCFWSSGHAHAVTQAVVVNQKIQIESTGRRETGNV